MFPNPTLIPYFPEILVAIYGGLGAVLIFLKIMKRGRARIQVLSKRRTYKTTHKKAKDKIKFSRDWEADYSPLDFFEEEKPSWIFWRLPRRMLIFIEDMKTPLRFKARGNKDMSELTWWWSKKEINAFIVKEIAKAKSQVKMISRIELVLILSMLAMNLFFLLLIGNRLGVFA